MEEQTLSQIPLLIPTEKIPFIVTIIRDFGKVMQFEVRDTEDITKYDLSEFEKLTEIADHYYPIDPETNEHK